MPGESSSLINNVVQLLESSGSIRVAHIVEDSNSKSLLVACLAGSLEAEDIGSRGAVGSGDDVVVNCVGLEVTNLNFVVELTALSDGDLGAWRSAIVSVMCKYKQVRII